MTFQILALLVLLVAFLAMQGKLTIRPRRNMTGVLACNVGGVPFEQVSKDAQIALTEFGQELTMALTQPAVEPWAKNLGLYKSTRALRTIWPIPISAAAFREFRGDPKRRDLFEKSIPLIPKSYFDGFSALARVVEAPDFIGWDIQPAAIAAAQVSLLNELIQVQLEANPVCYDGANFFTSAATGASSHAYNVFNRAIGTFANDITGNLAPSSANIATAKQNFRLVKAPNGKPLGLRMTHVLAPPQLEEVFKQLLTQDMIIQALPLPTPGTPVANSFFGAVDNIYKNTVKLIICDELTNATTWYPLALNKPGMLPWVVQDWGSPEIVVHDKTSPMFTEKRKIGMDFYMEGGGQLLLPQCIQRFGNS